MHSKKCSMEKVGYEWIMHTDANPIHVMPRG